MKTKLFNLKITEEELQNRDIKKKVLELIDAKIKQQRTKAIILSSVEFELIRNNGSFVPKERYATKLSDLSDKDEVGKYHGKRLIVK